MSTLPFVAKHLLLLMTCAACSSTVPLQGEALGL